MLLSNAEALELLLKAFDQFNGGEISLILDLDLKIMSSSPKAAEIINIPQEELVGKHYATDFRPQDFDASIEISAMQRAIREKKLQRTLSINFRRQKEFIVLFTHFRPFINKNTKDVIALHAISTIEIPPLAWFKIIDVLPQKSDKDAEVNKELLSKSNKLTLIEQEILFLLFVYDTYEEIAILLSCKYATSITPNKIGKIIRRNLLTKFNVFNLQSLKAKALKLNFHKNIPLSLLQETIIDIGSL